MYLSVIWRNLKHRCTAFIHLAVQLKTRSVSESLWVAADRHKRNIQP